MENRENGISAVSKGLEIENSQYILRFIDQEGIDESNLGM